MSLGHCISANLNLSCTRENLHQILNNAKKIGSSFFLTNIDELDPGNYKQINMDEAIEALYAGIPDPDMHVITLKHESIFINLSAIRHSDKTMTIMFTNFKYPWLLSSWEEYKLDISRYIKFFLELIGNYQILEMHIEKD